LPRATRRAADASDEQAASSPRGLSFLKGAATDLQRGCASPFHVRASDLYAVRLAREAGPRRDVEGGDERMMDDEGSRQPSNLRGRLAEIYVSALLDDAADALAKRLGDRATLYHPLFGQATGMAAIEKSLARMTEWLSDHSATQKRGRVIVGVDRDIAQSTLALRHEQRDVELLVAIVAERYRAREISVRVHHATQPFGRWQAARPARKPGEREHVVASDVAEHLAALRLGDVDAVVRTFETDGVVVDGIGRAHDRASGALKEHYTRILQNEHGANDWVPIVQGVADDGRACSIEYETTKLRGEEIAPKEGVMVFERGDSGLIRSVRVYDEVGYDVS
jgi:hypothetical protein